MIVTRGLGIGGSKFGALVSYGLGIDYVSSSGFLAEVPLWALNLDKYDPATTWDGSVFLFLPKANLDLHSQEVSALRSQHWLSKPATASLEFNNYGLHPTIKATANVWFKPDPSALNLSPQVPISNYTNGYLSRVPEKYLTLLSHVPTLSVTAGYLSRVATASLNINTFIGTIISDHKLLQVGTKALTLGVNGNVVKATANVFLNPGTGELTLVPKIPTVTGIGYVVLNISTGSLTVFGTGHAVLTGNYVSEPNSASLSAQSLDPTLTLSNNYLAKVLVSNLDLSKQNPNILLSINELIKVATYQLQLEEQGLEGKVSDHKNLVIEAASLQSNWLGVNAAVTGHYFSEPEAQELILGVLGSNTEITQDQLVRILGTDLHLTPHSTKLGWAYTGKVDTALLEIIANILEVSYLAKNRINVNGDGVTKAGLNKHNLASDSVTDPLNSGNVNLEISTPSRVSEEINASTVVSAPVGKIDVTIKNNSSIFSNKTKRFDVR